MVCKRLRRRSSSFARWTLPSPVLWANSDRFTAPHDDDEVEVGIRASSYSTAVPPNTARPVALVVGERVHRIQDHGPNPRLAQLASEMLAIQLEQDRVQETLGLAARGAGGDHGVALFLMDGADGLLLVHIQRMDDQRRKEVGDGLGKALPR